MAAITILHVSDVHFGERDRQGQQPEICNRLLENAHKHGELTGFCPDLCIFSGDLTFQGAEKEFESGEDWLKRLIKPWPNCRLFVVPGNHEVVRPTGDEANATKEYLRGSDNSGLNQQGYNGRRNSLSKGWQNLLSNFSRWHENARANQELRLVSDWRANLYGCRWEESISGLPIRVIGLNTALLSCEDNEQGKLVVDLINCNEALLNLTPEKTLSLVVAHHPWIARDSATEQTESWLVEWNRREIEKRLLQQTGAHLFLHGHVHKAQAESFSNSLGQHLVVLGAGATHQDPQYPLRFAFYRIDCNNQEIQPETFRYSHSTGRWELDPTLSKSFRAILPRVGPRYPSSRLFDDFDDFGFEILGTLHEINKTLDDLTQKAYELMHLPNTLSFEEAYDKYVQKYSYYIEKKQDSLSTRKERTHENIADLGRRAQDGLADARRSSNLHLSNLWSQFEQFNSSHTAIIKHMKTYPVLRSSAINSPHSDNYYTDLYAKIKTAKGVCDAAIGDGISFNRDFACFRLRVIMDD